MRETIKSNSQREKSFLRINKKVLSWFNVTALLIAFSGYFVGCSLLQKPAENIQMPAMFSSNMVLQQGIPVPFWGTASPGGIVTIQINDQKASVTVAEDSTWRIDFPAFESYGGPYTVEIQGKETLVFDNVMVGEVWVCSGQSNMEMPLAGWGEILNFEQEIANANHPNIRLLSVAHAIKNLPQTDIISDGWVECSPENIPYFSATAYFFGRHLNQNLDIPIGLIHTSWGGTPAEAWTSAEALATLPDFKDRINLTQEEVDQSFEAQMQKYERDLQKWNDNLDAMIQKTQGNGPKWDSPDLDTRSWNYMNLPVLWEKAGLEGFDGIVWFRKEINLTAAQAEADAEIHLGPINDIDITLVNGTQIGSLRAHDLKRVYTIPASVLKAGKNVIAVQVLDIGGNGGLWGTANEMKLFPASGNPIRLDGLWKYKTGLEMASVPPQPQSPESPNRLSVLYNGMLHPLAPFAIQGAIWYQGESNAGRAYQYRDLFKTMIQDWRSLWGQGDFPFMFTQLANFKAYKDQPGDDDWAELREAQLMALDLPNTGMAVTIDIGNADDIHPKNKQDVGKRLALNALNSVYGKTDVVPCGPLYKSSVVEEGKIRISFDQVDGGLEAKGGALKGFAIAGNDKKWVWANAAIDGETVVVSSPSVANPVAVRYAWQANPRCNLYNKAGLPASPFRTDTWKGITAGKK